MDRQLLLLASYMLELASEEFSNHGCNYLDVTALNLVENEERLCTDIQVWNGDPGGEWPSKAEHIGDSSLMAYLAYELKKEAFPKG